MKATTLFAATALLVAAVAQAATTPEVVTKEATGEAAIVNKDEAKATKEAQNEALRSAVEQVAGVLISAETITQNSQLLSDRIFSKSSGYVRSFKVLSKKSEKGVMTVTVSAVVGAAQLDKDLEAVQGLVRRHGSRRMVILTQEQAIDPRGVISSSGVMANVLTQAFEKDGWTIIDPHFAAGKVKLEPGVALGQVAAKEIGDLAKADYILYGNVNFRYQAPSTGGMIPEKDKDGNTTVFHVTGEYDLALFATDSGSQLSKVAGKFTGG
ncbi:MAG: flagellar assembly protein T N-terminal domain-containing protein, partial [Myxococcaceae bacterium]